MRKKRGLVWTIASMLLLVSIGAWIAVRDWTVVRSQAMHEQIEQIEQIQRLEEKIQNLERENARLASTKASVSPKLSATWVSALVSQRACDIVRPEGTDSFVLTPPTFDPQEKLWHVSADWFARFRDKASNQWKVEKVKYPDGSTYKVGWVVRDDDGKVLPTDGLAREAEKAC